MHQNHNFVKQFDYLVVGAGISGLQSLQILSRSTTSVLGLQSQDIAAGRVLSESVVSLPGAKKIDWIKENQNKLKNVFVQKGATWIQTRHKFLLQVCKQFGLELREQNTQGDNLYLSKDKSISASQLAANPKFGLQLKTFVRQIDHLAQLYEKYVLSSNKDKVRSNRMLAEYDTKIVSQFLQENIHSVQARQLVETFLQHTECVSCDENSMHQVLTKSARSNDIGILREFLGDYSDEGHEPSYLLNNGTYAIIQKFVQALQKRLKAPIQEIILFNQKVLTIDNKRDDFCVVTTLNSQTNKSSKFKAKKIICTVPLSVIRSITFTNISKSKRFILDNQLRTTCMKSFIIVKKPFWRRIASGDAIFSSQYLVNMCHDISPIDLSCGIMVFFHNGKKFDEWESHFKNEANQYEAKKKYIIDLTCKLFRVTEQEKKQYLDDCLFYISSFMDNPNIRSGFQSCTSPGTYTNILKLGQGIQAFYRDENNVFFVGSEFSSEFASYMEGAVRVAREKCFKLIGRQDDLFSSEKKKDKYQSSTNLTPIRAKL